MNQALLDEAGRRISLKRTNLGLKLKNSASGLVDIMMFEAD